MSNLIIWFIIFPICILFLFYIKRSLSDSKKQLQEQKEKELKTYELYLKRFNDINNLEKLEVQVTKVAGTKYNNEDTGVNRQDILSSTKENEILMLIPDELNRFDKDAIKVVRLNGEQIGFLDMDISIEIKSRLQNQSPVEAKILKIYKEKGNFEVELVLQRYSRKLKQKL